MELKLFQFSASKLKTYKLCGQQYYYKYINRVNNKERKNTAALFGTAMHKALEMKYRSNKGPQYTFITTMNEVLDEWQSSGEEVVGLNYINSYITEGKRILSTFDWDMYKPYNDNSLELEFKLPFPNKENPIAILVGYIDLISSDGMFGYNVIDYKTSKKPETSEELAANPQFILYRWAGIQLFGFPPTNVIWHQLRTGEQHHARVDIDFDNKMESLIQTVNEMITSPKVEKKEKDSFCTRLCSFYPLCYGE